MDYILMHRNVETAYIRNKMRIEEVYKPDELPVGLDNQYHPSLHFPMWLSHRTIPNNRIFAEYLRKAVGYDFTDAMLRNMSVSITDTYWMKPINCDLTWEQVNYHDNLFSNEVSKAVISHTDNLMFDGLHPDFTTDGMLEKTWILMEDKPYLLKFDDTHNREQLVGEVYASRVANYLGISHVPYQAIRIHGRYASICPCIITDSRTDMVHAMQYKWKYSCGSRELFNYLCDIDDEGITKMVAFDALTHQIDRHEHNFAFANNRLLPLYDSGRCLSMLSDTRPFCIDRIKQLQLLSKIPFHIPNISLLQGIYEEVCDQYQVTPKQEAKAAIMQGITELHILEQQLEAGKGNENDTSDTYERE